VFVALPLYDDNPAARIPVVTYALIGVCVAVFLWQLGGNDEAVALTYGMIPSVLFGGGPPPFPGVAEVPGWVTLFTSMFLHGGWLHLGGNMLFLWIFGNNIEDVLGPARYLLLYLLSGIAAALCQALADPASTVPMVGASGAIAGVLGAYLLLYPYANVHVLLWIIVFVRLVTIPAWIVLGLWFGLQLVSGLLKGAADPGVAFWAHVGGFVTGLGLLAVLRPRGTSLLQEAKTPAFTTAPPGGFPVRRPPGGAEPPDGSGPWDRPGPWDRRGPWG
jgi:membrane associated rhomboid family serine protease